MASKPPPDFDLGGRHYTGEYRLRAGFFGFVYIEERVLFSDGRVSWLRRPGWHGPVYLSSAHANQRLAYLESRALEGLMARAESK